MNLQCAQLPSRLCVYGVSPPGKDSIRRFNPSTGESSQLIEVPTQGTQFFGPCLQTGPSSLSFVTGQTRELLTFAQSPIIRTATWL